MSLIILPGGEFMSTKDSDPYRESDPYRPGQMSDNASPTGILAQTSTRVRYAMLFFGFTMSVLLYLHRFSMSVAQPTIRDELGLDDQQMGNVASAFFYVYAIAQIPAGWLSDRFGARWTMSIYVFLWSLALMGLGTANGLISLIVFRALLGLAQAGAYPCAASANKRWFPVSRRATANTIVGVGGRVGNLLAVALTPVLMALVGATLHWNSSQWRPVFVFYGLLGIVWAIGYAWYSRNSPNEHPSCNDAERALIGDVPPAGQSPDHRSARDFVAGLLRVSRGVVLCPTLWLMCSISILVNVGWIFLVTFLPTYFDKLPNLGLSKVQIGFLVTIPGLASMCGGLSGGRATDWFVQRFGLRWGRRLTGIISSASAAIVYCAVQMTDDWRVLIVLFATIGFLIDFGLGALWAVYQDIAGRRVAAVLGIANMCGNFAAAWFSSVIGGFAKANDWQRIFTIASIALACNVVLWFGVNATAKMDFGDTQE